MIEIRGQAIMDFLSAQRNAQANEAAQLAGEIAVLKAQLAERDAEIAGLKAKKK